MPLVGQTVVVRKLDYATGNVVVSWPGMLIELTEDLVVVRAPFVRASSEPVRIADGVVFQNGDLFTEFYYVGRWYNIFHVADPAGRSKGWYCNVTRPIELDDEGISYVDMALDLFVRPDGTCDVLDEDEFAAGCAAVYSADDQASAREALEDLLGLVMRGSLPTTDP